jgi:hypothetical protein
VGPQGRPWNELLSLGEQAAGDRDPRHREAAYGNGEGPAVQHPDDDGEHGGAAVGQEHRGAVCGTERGADGVMVLGAGHRGERHEDLVET